MSDDQFRQLCNVYGFAPSRALRELIDCAVSQARVQRKPLTEEEIDSIWDSEKAFADIYAITRAIERAHGIGEQQ